MTIGYDVTRTVNAAGGLLDACLRMPNDAAPGPVPAVLLLSSAGPRDHAEDEPNMARGIQAALADALAAVGCASLRFGQRDVMGDGSVEQASFARSSVDALAAWSTLVQVPAIDASRVAVIGHSEGAMQALQLTVAASLPARPVATVLLAAAARPGRDVLLWQTATLNGQASDSRWSRPFLDYDPRPDLARVTTPLLAVTGAKDLQVPPKDLETIAALVPGCETLRPQNLTHLLRQDPLAPTAADYPRQLAEPVDPVLLSVVVRWIEDVMSAPAGGMLARVVQGR